MENHFSNLNILAVEDNYLNLSILEKYIEIIGARSESAHNGIDCLNLYQKSAIGYYDAIFIDLKMPFLDGYETAKKIRSCARKDNNIFIVAMSGESYENETENFIESKIDAFMEKPIDIDTIKKLLWERFFDTSM